MKRLACFLLILCILLPTGVSADGVFFSLPSQVVYEPTQKVALRCFPEYGEEQTEEILYLQVRYQGDIDNFAWLVPTSAEPEVDVADSELFSELRKKMTKLPLVGGMGASEGANMVPPQVTVLQQKQVGVYDITVLEANESNILVSWLTNNGYNVSAAATTVLDYYINKGWFYFTAMKIAPDSQTATTLGDLKTGEIEPIKLTFETADCVFPLKISSVNPGGSDIELYVLADEYVANDDLYYIKSDRIHEQLPDYSDLIDMLGIEDTQGEIYVSVYGKILTGEEMLTDLEFEAAGRDYIIPENYGSDYVVDLGRYDDFYLHTLFMLTHGFARGRNCEGVLGRCFLGYKDITRGEFAKLVVNTLDLQMPAIFTVVEPFPDLPAGHEFYQPVMIMKALAMINGYPDGEFKQWAPISRGEAVKILIRALEVANNINLTGNQDLDTVMADIGVDTPFAEYIRAAVMLELIDLYYDGTFRLNNSIMRGDAAKMIVEGRINM